MSSSESESALRIELATPWRLAGLATFVALLAMVSIVLLPLGWTWRSALVLGVASASAMSLFRFWRHAPRAISLDAGGSIRVRGAGGRERHGALADAPELGPWTIGMRVRWTGGGRGQLLVSRWAAGAPDFRRLKVFLATSTLHGRP